MKILISLKEVILNSVEGGPLVCTSLFGHVQRQQRELPAFLGTKVMWIFGYELQHKVK